MPNYESMLSLTKQGINIFNSSDEFYNDLCYDYELNGTKDVAYKDRLKVFYPNISLCDSRCKQIRVFWKIWQHIVNVILMIYQIIILIP